MPISINTYEAIKSYLDVRLRSSDGLQNLANLPQNLRKNYRFWQQQDSEIKTLLQITDLSRSDDSQKLKNKILETFQAYKIYFEAKFQDNSDIEKILTSFTDQGNFFKSIAPSEAEYANIVELMRGLNSYLLNLILPLTEKDLEESKKEEIKRLILSSLIEFPGKNGDNPFACIAGTRERISLASLASSNLLLHQQVIAEQLEEKSTRLSPNIYIGNRAHLPSSLLYSLSFLTDEDAEKLDQHYKVPQCDTSLFDVIKILKTFKSESKIILEKRIQDIIDEYRRLLEKLSKLEEIPAKTTKLRETIQELLAATVDQDKITLLENIKSNIDISFLKSLADLFPAEINFRELERLLELQSGNHYGQGQIRQVTEKLESILQKFSKLTEDQYKLRLLSDFQQKVQMEIDRDLLESTYDFFPTKKEEENDDDYGYGYEISSEKLKPSEELKLYFEEHLHKKYPQLYFLGDQGSECFKYLGDLDLFYDQGCTNLLDPKKISNLLSLFETIALSDSAGDIKIKKDKITAGILVLKNLCQNFKDSNDIYLLVFFDEFRKTKKTSFDIFFRNIFSSNPDLSRLLSPIFESIKTKRESLSSSYRGNELNILKQIFLCKKREFKLQEQGQQINIKSLKFNVNQKFGRQRRNIFYFLVMNGQVGLISKIIDEKLDLFFVEDNRKLSPLDYAIKSNNLEVLKIIFDKLSYVPEGWNESLFLVIAQQKKLLYRASDYGHHKITQLLINKFLECNQLDLLKLQSTEQLPLITAIDKGFDEVAKILISYQLGQEDLDESQNNALHNAILIGNTEIAKLLIDRYSDLVHKVNLSLITPLHLASHEGHVEVVKLLLEKRANVNSRDHNNNTPLHYASEKGHVEVVKLLLEKRANVNSRDHNNNTPLHHASHKGHVEVVKLLLEKGADVNSRDHNNNTPLHHASHKGHVEVVKLLLEKGADVNSRDHNNNTPLYHASNQGHIEVVRLLIESGADIEQIKGKSNTVYSVVAQHQIKEVHDLLLKSSNFLSKIKLGEYESAVQLLSQGAVFNKSILTTEDKKLKAKFTDFVFHVVESNNTDLVKILIEKLGADFFDLRNEGGVTPLHIASENRSTDLVKLLINYSSKPANYIDICDKSNSTPLHYAYKESDTAMVEILLQRGANIEQKNNQGETPLHLASKEGDIDMVKILLQRGANIEQKNNQGETPLHLASKEGNIEIVEILLQRGANIEQKNNKGETVLDVANQSQENEIVTILTKYQPSQSFEDSIHANNFESAVQLLSQGAVFNKSILTTEDKNLKAKFTDFVFYAVKNNKTDLVKILIEKLGADFFDITNGKNTIIEHALLNYNQEKRELIEILLGEFKKLKQTQIVDEATGYTPFYYLRYYGDQKEDTINSLVEILVNLGYDINAKSKSGLTAFHNLFSYLNSTTNISSYCGLIKAFIKGGADINKAIDGSGDTPLHIAVQNSSSEVIRILLENMANCDIKNSLNDTPRMIVEKIKDAEVKEEIEKIFAQFTPTTRLNLPRCSPLRRPLSAKSRA